MYIKQIIIRGFKSYKDQTVVEPFDKRHNVIVGRNGSGKSNFFVAIEFVLSEEYAQLQDKQRQALLHESTGPRSIDAYVEIIFDNSDSRFPVDNQEIMLKRVIGAKKDQYFLNKKLTPRSDVRKLLESAGFSSSNPYYIIKQGTINQLATAPDSQRLKLFREIAGLGIYDERRGESLAILRETKHKLQNIDVLLSTFEERLNTLEQEQEELKQYQYYDKTRRVLEFVIYEIESEDNKKKLEQLEQKRTELSSEQEKLTANLKSVQDNIHSLRKTSKMTKKDLKALEDEKNILDGNNQELIKKKIKLQLTIKDLSEGDKSKKTADELIALEQSIEEKERELKKVKSRYNPVKKQEEEYIHELVLKEQKRMQLYAKQGRGSQFSTKEDRDKWIENELQCLNKQLKKKIEHRDKLDADVKKDGQLIVELREKIEKTPKELEIQKNVIDEQNKLISELKMKRHQNQSTKRDLWLKENDIQQNLSFLKDERTKADQKLRSLMGKHILNGCDSVRRVLGTFNSRGGREADITRGYYGLVIDNFDCSRQSYTAVEVTAGHMLFHHVVETDLVATQIIHEINRQKLPGEFYFVALNKLIVEIQRYPKDKNVIPMLSILNYDKKYDKVMHFLFGRTLICQNMEKACEFARSTRLNCVTLDGEKTSSRGVMTGGYMNISKSRIENHKKCGETIKLVNQCEQELRSLTKKLENIEKTINTIVSDIQKTETNNNEAKGIHDKRKVELRLWREELSNIERSWELKELSLNQCKTDLEAMKATEDNLKSELNQELLSQLSVDDQAQINSLNNDIQKLQKEKNEVFNNRMKIETTKNQLENLLQNKRRRYDGLSRSLEDISLKEHKLSVQKTELEDIHEQLNKINEKMTVVDNSVKDLMKKINAKQSEFENWKKKENEIEEKIGENAKLLDKFVTKQNFLERRMEEYKEKFQQLGVLPSEEMNSYYDDKLSSKDLFKELQKANNKLKQFSHVNKKCVDQFISCSDLLKKQKKRKEEFIKAEEKLKEFIGVTEQKKQEFVEFTYKQISMYFTQIFKKLVPTGHAKLVLKTKDHEIGVDDDENADSFIGIGIKVSFINAEVEMKELNQLSGGQKSLVALALIFAIQKCDPNPFYVFDEVDQALDPNYRKSVANMINELSSESQFITTTFRPEFLDYANKFYSITLRNKASHIRCVTKEEAKGFVENNQIQNP